MARNKHPEKTVEKILDVSFHLFAEKGYEKTTIQDIVTALGMSKGAIYHHFKSKEDILNALTAQSFSRRNSMLVFHDDHLNGAQRIKKFMILEFSDPEKQQIDKMCAALFQIPKFAVQLMRTTLENSAPLFAKMVEAANADGSAYVEDPLMCAEVMMMLSNLWANPILQGNGKAIFLRRIRTIGKVLDGLGLPVMDEEMIQIISAYYDQVQTV